MKIVTLATLVALAILGALTSQASASTPSPQRSARLMASCLHNHGWSASTKGRQVRATGARTRPANSYPRHPRYQATFSDFGRAGLVEVRWALNDGEEHRVNRCLSSALRGVR